MRAISSSLRPVRFLCALALLASLGLAPTDGMASAKTAKATAGEQRTSSVSQAFEPLNLTVDRAASVRLPVPASSVFIATPEVADIQVLSPTSVMVFGKKTGQTTLIASDASGHEIAHRNIVVTQNLDDLRVALNAVIPGHRIKAEAVPNGIVLTGEVNDPSTVEDAKRLALRYVPREGGEVINRLKVHGNDQIQIRVRFAEVSRDVDKRFGIDWESIGNVGAFAFGIASGNAVISEGSNLLDRARTTSGSSTNDIISASVKGKNYNVNGLIDALAANGLVTILAEPNLTAMSGETASFLAGGEFPIPVPQSQTAITIDWKQYGVSLAFTPTLLGGNRINLHVRPEVSQLTDSGSITLSGIVVPALSTRRAETTIELASGQSFAIAGLLNNKQSESVSKYPFLGDLPILGTLFRSSRFQNNESELVIIITPYVVRAAENQEQLALPTDGFSPPSDTDFFFKGRETNSNPAARTLSGQPRAVRVETSDEAPAPTSAPTAPVAPAPAPITAPASRPVPTPAPEPMPEPRAASPAPAAPPVTAPPAALVPAAAPAQTEPAPVGPGGFMLE